MDTIEQAIIDQLDAINWMIYDDHQLRGTMKDFSYYISDEGKVQVWYGSKLLKQFVAPEALTTYALNADKAEKELMDKLAESLGVSA